MSMWLTWNPNRYCLLMLFSIFAWSTSIHQTLIFLLNKSKITFFLVLGSWLHKKIFFAFLNSVGRFFKEVGPIFVLWFLLCLSLKLNRTWLLHNSIFQIFEIEIRNYWHNFLFILRVFSVVEKQQRSQLDPQSLFLLVSKTIVGQVILYFGISGPNYWNYSWN